MPFLRIQTNQGAFPTEFLENATRAVAEGLGKSPDYVQVVVEPGLTMGFAGSDEATAFLELRALDLAEEQAGSLAAPLTALAVEALGVAPERVFLNFLDVPRERWGWNGRTFA